LILRNAAEGVAENGQRGECNNWDSGNQPDSRRMTTGDARAKAGGAIQPHSRYPTFACYVGKVLMWRRHE
jgi:hypothetical protein